MTRIIHRLARLFIAAACLGELALPAGTLPLSENARKMDANGNGLIERREASGTTAAQFALIDENRDSVLSGTRKDIEALRQYLEDMSAGVAAEVAAGRSLAETQKRVTLVAYTGWKRYDTNLQGHVAQVYATVKGTQ